MRPRWGDPLAYTQYAYCVAGLAVPTTPRRGCGSGDPCRKHTGRGSPDLDQAFSLLLARHRSTWRSGGRSCPATELVPPGYLCNLAQPRLPP